MGSLLSKVMFASPLVTKDFGLLIMRLWFGLAMAFAHGLPKFDKIEGLAQGLAQHGLPAPEFMAWMAALTEFVGGICLALGLVTRFWAVGLLIAMAVAAFVAHAADPFKMKEMALTYGVGYLVLLVTGAGRFSVDWLLGRSARASHTR